MAKIYKIIFLLLTFNSFLYPQHDDIKFEHITVEDGLASNRIHFILQDSRGFIWFGTVNGLHKFDGYKFTNYKPDTQNPNSIGHLYSWSIMEDDNGDIWIGTYGGGLHKFDHEKEIFVNYKNENNDPYSLSNNFVSVICQSPADSGKTLWVGTRWGGLNKFNLVTEKFYNSQNSTWDFPKINTKNIFKMYFDREGTLWIGTAGSGIINYDLKTENFVCYTNNPKNENSLSNNQVRSVYQDNLGNIWIGTEGGLNRFDKNQKKFTRYISDPNNKNSLSDNNIISIYQDRSGYLWIGTFSGLNILNPETEKFERIHSDLSIDHGLSHDYITSIYQDASGIFWIGTLGGGINKYNSNTKNFKHFRITVENYTKTNINSVRSIQEDKTNNKILWIGTSGAGLIKYNHDTNKYIHHYSQNIPVFVRSIYQSSQIPNSIWIATWGQGLIKLDKNLNHIYKRVFWSQNPNFKDAYHISTIYEIKDGMILLGTCLGLYQFDCFTEKYISYPYDPDDPNSLSHPNVTSICRDHSGNFWIGTHGGGLNKFILKSDSAAIDLKHKGKFIHFKNNPENPKSISSNTITCVYKDKKNIIWIGTKGGGLNKLVSDNSHEFNVSSAKFVHYREKNGLPGNVILGILEDDNGNLWLSTNNGISKFDPVNETFRNYDIRDGLQGNEFNRLACFKGKNGEMYFGGTNGFNVFHPDSIKENHNIPSVVLTEFQIFNKPIKPGGKSPIIKSISETEQIILSHDQTVFSLEFAALEYTISGKNNYTYKMEGVDPEWVYTDASRRFATYTNLDPGEYLFKVKGSNCDGIWNEEGTSVKVIIQPPWWKTDIAYPIYALIFIITLFSIIRYETIRLRHNAEQKLLKEREQAQLREVKLRAETAEFQARALESQQDAEKERIRSRIAGDLHDEIGSNLSSISMISQTLEKRGLESGELKKRLKDIQHISRITAESMRDIVWFVNPENDEPHKFISKMRQTAGIMLGMEFDFNSPTQPHSMILTLDIRRNLFLIYKEILHNIIKHAQADRVDISLSQTDNILTLEVTDNGIGFDLSAITEGSGLKNFYRRAQQIGGEVEITSELDKGTKVKVSIKIP